jgi:hypothetical protein
VRTGAGRKSSNQERHASTPLQAARARIAELEGEVSRLKRELAGRVTIPRSTNIVEEAFAAAAAVAGGRDCIHGATYGACRKLGCAPKRG